MEKYTTFLTMTVLGAAVCASLAILTIARRKASGARFFAVLMVANVVYAFSYIFELTAPTMAGMLMAIKIEYIGISIIPPLWLLFTLEYAGYTRYTNGIRLLTLFALPAITVLLIWTNDIHSLYYLETSRRLDLAIAVFDPTPGPWYYVNAAFQYLFFLGGIGLLLNKAKRLGPQLRSQAILLCISAGIALIANLLYLLGLTPEGLDSTPLALMFSGLFLYLGIFKYQLFDLAPIARERVVEALNDGVLVLDPKGRLLDANIMGRQLLAAAVAAAEGTIELSKDVTRPLDQQLQYADEGLALLPIPRTSGEKEVEFSLYYQGEARRFRAVTTDILSHQKKTVGSIITIGDVTETTLLMERLARLAATDELTGIDNRRRFVEAARREVSLAKRNGRVLAILMFDLDNFKKINDSYGHSAGDEILKQLVSRCKTALRTSDLFCRYGGEEFAVLLPDADEFGAMEVAERLRYRIAEQAIYFNGSYITTTISVGVATLNLGSTESIESLLQRADIAMYRAKESGRNTVRSASGRKPPRPEPLLPGDVQDEPEQ